MEFLTKKHMSRRTVLRGLGVTMALPLLDAMTPAATAFAKTTAAATQGAPVGDRDGARLRRRDAVRPQQEPVVAGRGRHRVRPEPGRAVVARAVPRLRDDRQQHRRPQRRGVLAAGNRRRSLPLERRVPDAVASQEDAGLRRARRHLARSAVCAEVRPGHGDSVDAAAASRPSISPAAAPTVTAAPTPTASAGRRPSSRCR